MNIAEIVKKVVLNQFPAKREILMRFKNQTI